MSDGAGGPVFGGSAYGARSRDLARFRPDDLDELVAATVREVGRGDAAHAEHIRRSSSSGEQYTLLTFSRRRAADALRRRDRELATEAVMAFALVDGDRLDPRDTSPDFPLLSARETGTDVVSLVDSTVARSETRIAGRLRASLDRLPSISIGSCALLEVRTPEHGLGFVRTGLRQRPPAELAAAAIAIADALDAEGTYAVDSIAASDLPAIWFDGRANVGRIPSRGCVALTASHRDAREPWSHGLLVFVAQTGGEMSADLARRAAGRSVPDRPRVVFAAGDAIALVIGGSSTMGEGSFETEDSLQRFGPVLAAILG